MEERKDMAIESKKVPANLCGWSIVILLTVVCSWYGGGFHGRLTASGTVYNVNELTAAHRYLPFGTLVVLFTDSSKVLVEVTDRGPFVEGREFDLSPAAFKRLAPCWTGLVNAEYLILRRGEGQS